MRRVGGSKSGKGQVFFLSEKKAVQRVRPNSTLWTERRRLRGAFIPGRKKHHLLITAGEKQKPQDGPGL